MSLRVWLPLTKDLRNQGLDDVTIINNGATFDANGKLGGCYYFNRSAPNYLKITNPLTTATNGVSMAFWVKLPSNGSVNDQLVHIGNGSGWTNNRFTCFVRGGNSTLIFACGDGTNSTQYSCVSSALTLNQWTHVVCLYENNKMKIYLNGALNKEYSTTIVPSFTNVTYIGIGAGPNVTEPATAYLNDVRIYDHALSPLEVKHISQGLILHYPLNRNGWGQENLALNTHNLNLNSNKNNLYMYFRGAATRRLRTDGFYEAYCTGDWQGLSFWANQLNLKSGDKIIYSFYIYTNGTSCGYSFYPMIFNSSGSRDTSTTFPISIDGDNYINSNARTFGNTTTTSPEKHYVVFEWNDSVKTIIDNGGSIELSIQVYGGNWTNRWACIYAPKIEKGDKVTPWCPNEADALATTLGLNDNVEYDTSGYGNNGTKVGSFDYDSDTPKYNVSTVFPSGINWINAGRGAMVQDSITISCWVNYSSWGNPISCTEGGGWNFEEGNGGIRTPFYISGIGYKTAQSTITSASLKNGWHMLTSLYDRINSIVKIFIDGELAGSLDTGTTNKIAYNGNNVIMIGAEAGGSATSPASTSFIGKISDFRIYATALSAEDIKDLYNLGASIDSNNNLLTYELNEE